MIRSNRRWQYSYFLHCSFSLILFCHLCDDNATMCVFTSIFICTVLTLLSDVFFAWHVNVVLWWCRCGFNLSTDFAVTRLPSGSVSLVFFTPLEIVLPDPSSHVNCKIDKNKNASLAMCLQRRRRSCAPPYHCGWFASNRFAFQFDFFIFRGLNEIALCDYWWFRRHQHS